MAPVCRPNGAVMAIQTAPTCRMKWGANKRETAEQMEPSIKTVEPRSSSAHPGIASKEPIAATEKSIASNSHLAFFVSFSLCHLYFFLFQLTTRRDVSDELDCGSLLRRCADGDFRCPDGQCIAQAWRYILFSSIFCLASYLSGSEHINHSRRMTP